MLQSALVWFSQNFLMGIIGCAVVFAGLLFMAGRMTLLVGIGILIGSIIAANWQQIAASIGGFGGSAGFG